MFIFIEECRVVEPEVCVCVCVCVCFQVWKKERWSGVSPLCIEWRLLALLFIDKYFDIPIGLS